jgi:hypothetical protein
MVLYKRFKKYNAGLLLNAEIRTSQLQFKKKEAMAQIKDAIDKVIEIESQNIKPNEKVVVNIDTNDLEGIKIHAKKVLIGSK